MRILISGSTGLIGRSLTTALMDEDHKVVKLVRPTSKPSKDTVFIDYENRNYELSDFEGFDSVIHLAGESIVSRWTERKKREIVKSRVDTTRLLVDIFKKVSDPPRHFLCASAIGIYKTTEPVMVDEYSSLSGSGFLVKLARDWEEEAGSARDFGARVVNLRIGLVLDKRGGTLSKMLLPFSLGLGGHIGSGEQIWNWISINDIVSSIKFVLNNDKIEGPVNLVSPNPCTNAHFTKILAEVLNRPAFFHLPGFIIKLIFGEMAEEVVLFGVNVKPKKLLENNYRFIDTDLKKTLIKLVK